jgi:hypothetical protein
VLEPYFQGPRCRTYKLMLVPDMLARIPYAFCLNVNDLQNFLAPLVHGGRTFVPQIFAYEMAATSYIFWFNGSVLQHSVRPSRGGSVMFPAMGIAAAPAPSASRTGIPFELPAYLLQRRFVKTNGSS